MMDYEMMFNLAKKWVIEAGKMSQEKAGNELEITFKTSPSDLVTIVDKEIESFMTENILSHFPDHGIVGEEGVFEKDPDQFNTLWIIDPIDGTTNFVHQKMNYVISLALVHKGEGQFGIIYDPSRDELFWAVRGKGAFLNEERLQLQSSLKMEEALLCTSLFWSKRAEENGLLEMLHELPRKCRGIRVYGCAALEMAYVAAGRIDAYVSMNLNPWDFAGGKIILEEAGGKVTKLNGGELPFRNASPLLACHPSLHAEFISYLNK